MKIIKMKTRMLALAAGLMVMVSPQVMAQESTFASVTGKKLIEYGWDVPTPEYVRDHIRDMEKRPFEGVIFRLPKSGGNVFNIDNWDKNKVALQDETKVVSAIKWNKFTDNFLAMYAASTMDWYSDSDWEKVLSAVKFNAKVARAAHCKGLLFDPEPYGFNPWTYAKQKHASQYSYAQYAEKVQQRGRQFMRAMQGEMPDVRLLMFYQYKMFYGISHSTDPAARTKAISGYSYGLMLPFLNGMLEAAGPQVQLIEGNEPSYYYTDPAQFYQAYWEIRQGARINVPDALKAKFDRQERAANALYVDHLFAMRSRPNVSTGMTPQERAQWFEQNVYYGLKTSDEYVWLYSEKMNWWTNTDVPPGLEDSIISAKTKLAAGRDLGFNLETVFKTAQAKLDQSLRDKLQKRSATVPRLSATQAPKIDGNLEEKIYTELPWADPFVGYVQQSGTATLQAATRAFIAYDDQNVYIAFRCSEPDMKKQQVISGERDSGIWAGESVEISLLKPGQPADDADAIFYHFILNPANDHWDGINTGANSDVGFNPAWQSATTKQADGWTSEIAIPWKSLGIADIHSGLTLHANLARQRMSAQTEYSSWSQFVSGFQEPQNFGAWTLE